MSCGVSSRCSLDPVLLWLWHRPAAAALFQRLAWEHPHAADVALDLTFISERPLLLCHDGISLYKISK